MPYITNERAYHAIKLKCKATFFKTHTCTHIYNVSSQAVTSDKKDISVIQNGYKLIFVKNNLPALPGQ